jgi:hypothetical protein
MPAFPVSFPLMAGSISVCSQTPRTECSLLFRHPCREINYSTRLRRRWIRTTSTITAKIAAMTRIIVTLSMVYSPFLLSEVLSKTVHYYNCCRTQSYQEERGEDKQNERENEFDRRLRCLLLHLLATLGSQGV